MGICMFYNIKRVLLHRVFHGIRFKVNEDWESGKIPFFYFFTFFLKEFLEISRKTFPKIF